MRCHGLGGRVTLAVCAFAVMAGSCAERTAPRPLEIATTTSVQNSGLLDILVPASHAETGIELRVHAAGSGLALQMMARGFVDLVISHAPEAETRFLSQHPHWVYRKMAYNEFVVVGPPSDPAAAKDAHDAVDAFARIDRSGETFVSRGDGSGTHERESALWRLAGMSPTAGRLIVSGRGMAVALRHADEVPGYTLSDEATFWQFQRTLDLAIVYRGDPRLLNTYAVVHAGRRVEAATLLQWLTAGEGRDHTSAYRANGRVVFRAWPLNCPSDRPENNPCVS